jgi:hypothetical protein
MSEHDPLRDESGRFRGPTFTERLLGLVEPEPAPPEPPEPRGRLIPAGPMSDGNPDSGDLIRAALIRLRRH